MPLDWISLTATLMVLIFSTMIAIAVRTMASAVNAPVLSTLNRNSSCRMDGQN